MTTAERTQPRTDGDTPRSLSEMQELARRVERHHTAPLPEAEITARRSFPLPVVATLARLLCQELTLQNEYLRVENKMLRSKLPKRLQFTDDERRCLVDAALGDPLCPL